MSTPENDTNEALAEERVSAEAAAEVDVVVAEGTDADVAEGTDADAAATEDVISDDAENSDEAAPAAELEVEDPVAELKLRCAAPRVTGTSSTRTPVTRTRSRPTSRLAFRTSMSATTSSRWKFPPKRSPRSRTASASRSTARFCPDTSSFAWSSTTSRGAPCATRLVSPVLSVPRRVPRR